MSNKLRQPRIAAQVCEIVHALSARRVQPIESAWLSSHQVPGRMVSFVHQNAFLYFKVVDDGSQLMEQKKPSLDGRAQSSGRRMAIGN